MDGNKTYFVAALMAIYAVSGLLLGYHDISKTLELLLAAGTVIGFRSALAKLSND